MASKTVIRYEEASPSCWMIVERECNSTGVSKHISRIIKCGIPFKWDAYREYLEYRRSKDPKYGVRKWEL